MNNGNVDLAHRGRDLSLPFKGPGLVILVTIMTDMKHLDEVVIKIYFGFVARCLFQLLFVFCC